MSDEARELSDGARRHVRYTERRAFPPTGPTANELRRTAKDMDRPNDTNCYPENRTHIVLASIAQRWAYIQEVEDSETPLS